MSKIPYVYIFFYFVTVLSAKKINFRHMRGTTFPSTAATASRYWIDYKDRIEIPSMDLMKSMEMNGASYLILLAYKNVEALLDDLGERYFSIHLIFLLEI